MSINKWGVWPASSLNPVVRRAYMAGATAAKRDDCLDKARRALSPAERQIWVNQARFQNHYLITYLQLLRQEGV